MQRLLLVPTVIRNLQPRIARGREWQAIIDRMVALCTEFGTAGLRPMDEGLEIAPAPLEREAALHPAH